MFGAREQKSSARITAAAAVGARVFALPEFRACKNKTFRKINIRLYIYIVYANGSEFRTRYRSQTSVSC